MNFKELADRLNQEHPRAKTTVFFDLLGEIYDLDVAMILWVLWGEQCIRILDKPLPALNPGRKWYWLSSPRTIRSLLLKEQGKNELLRVFNDASAWL